MTEEITYWSKSNIQIFWAEVAQTDHLVQFYENDKIFLNTLEGFAGDGFIKGESVIVIATPEHIPNLNIRLLDQGFDIESLQLTGQYLFMDASEAASKFIINGWPDEELFNDFVAGLINRMQKPGLKVRVFGEMVAILWEQGYHSATIQLEKLWHRIQQEGGFCLYCAYPKGSFINDSNNSIEHICNSHSKLIAGLPHPSTEIHYTTTV